MNEAFGNWQHCVTCEVEIRRVRDCLATCALASCGPGPSQGRESEGAGASCPAVPKSLMEVEEDLRNIRSAKATMMPDEFLRDFCLCFCSAGSEFSVGIYTRGWLSLCTSPN